MKIPSSSVPLLLLVNFVSVQVGIDAYVPHRKYQVKPYSSPWFSSAYAAAIVHRNQFFHLHKQNIMNVKKNSDRLVILQKGS